MYKTATVNKNKQSFGNAVLYRVLIRLLKVADIRLFYALSAIFIIPISLLFSSGARLTYRYYREKRNLGGLRSLWLTYKKHCLFAQTVIDKFAVYAGKTFKFEYEGLDYYNNVQQSDDALLQLSAHIGCSEILGYTLKRQKAYNVLVDGEENEALMDYRRMAFGENEIAMIPVGRGTESSEKIIEALDKGEIVGAFADRYMNSEKIIVSRIYGHDAKLAKGPFSLAATRGIDVVMVNAMKGRGGSYKAFFTPLHYDKTLSPKQQRQQLADAYTAEIERLMDIYPQQWFNYFNLWK